MSIEAMKLALEAFEWNYNTDLDNIPACEQWAKMLKQNITVLRQAIEQAEQPEGSQEPEHQKWCASLTQLLLSYPPQPAQCNCQTPLPLQPTRIRMERADESKSDVWWNEAARIKMPSPDLYKHGDTILCWVNEGDYYAQMHTTPPPRQPDPVIDKSAAIRIATALGWTPPRQPLSEEQIQYAFRTNSVMVDDGNAYMVAGKRAVNIARAIEAACIKGEA